MDKNVDVEMNVDTGLDAERDVEQGSIWSEPRWRYVIWVVLAVAFSPVLINLFHHGVTQPWSRVSLVFPWLAWVAARSQPERDRSPSTGLVWGALLFALLLELVAVSGDAPRIARLGFGVGLVGVVWGAGWVKTVPAMVLLWVVPLPTMLLRILSPSLERFLAEACSPLLSGLTIQSVGPMPAMVGATGEVLVLSPASGGLALVFGLAGIGWFRAAARGEHTVAAVQQATRFSLLGLPLQWLILWVAGFLVAGGGRLEGARMILDHAGWVLVCLLGLAVSIPFLRSSLSNQPEDAPC